MHVPGSPGDGLPLVLLHGSNGTERDLLGLAADVRPAASLLAVRGDVVMDPGFAFFRRFPDRRVDVDDLRSRASRLARFIRLAGAGPRGDKPIAIGYSNGAIMAIALLLDAPDVLAGAILLRPLLPFEPGPGAAGLAKPVLVVDGADDRRRAPDDGLRVCRALRRAGALVRHETSASGHLIGPDDVAAARSWLEGFAPPPGPGEQRRR